MFSVGYSTLVHGKLEIKKGGEQNIPTLDLE